MKITINLNVAVIALPLATGILAATVAEVYQSRIGVVMLLTGWALGAFSMVVFLAWMTNAKETIVQRMKQDKSTPARITAIRPATDDDRHAPVIVDAG